MKKIIYFGKIFQYLLMFSGLWLIGDIIEVLPSNLVQKLLIPSFIFGLSMTLVKLLIDFYNYKRSKRNIKIKRKAVCSRNETSRFFDDRLLFFLFLSCIGYHYIRCNFYIGHPCASSTIYGLSSLPMRFKPSMSVACGHARLMRR